MTAWFILILLVVGGGVLLVAAVGLVLLIVGIVKRKTPVWVVGLVLLLPALAGGMVGVPLLMIVGFRASRMEHVHREAVADRLGAAASRGARIERHGRDLAVATAAGVTIEVHKPGGGSNHTRTRTRHSLTGGWERRYEMRVGEVEIVVEDDDGRITLRVEGRSYGRVRPGDTVVVTEDREVRINGRLRGTASTPL